jgi:hypothetical protein
VTPASRVDLVDAYVAQATAAVNAARAEVDRLRADLAAFLDGAAPAVDPAVLVRSALAATPHRDVDGRQATAATRDAWAAANVLSALADAGWLLPLPPQPCDSVGRRVAHVLTAVAAEYDVDSADLTGGDHKRATTTARHAAMYLLRDFGMSFPEIGRIFGRDHTTVMAACRRTAAKVDLDPVFAAQVDSCRPTRRAVRQAA